ncbi:MAG: hypothetical protein LLG02_05695 [Pelosinus sp.]|nr:hypothetical protein [Pelosinus sp.]
MMNTTCTEMTNVILANDLLGESKEIIRYQDEAGKACYGVVEGQEVCCLDGVFEDIVNGTYVFVGKSAFVDDIKIFFSVEPSKVLNLR